MNNTQKIYLEIDISKDSIDVSIKDPFSLKLENRPSGYAALKTEIKRLGGDFHIACEPTGGYEKSILRYLWKHSITEEEPRRFLRLRVSEVD